MYGCINIVLVVIHVEKTEVGPTMTLVEQQRAVGRSLIANLINWWVNLQKSEEKLLKLVSQTQVFTVENEK